ncbi:calcyclin-binding protein isoform X1 [Podarcis raffonei]|uniref:calcyclin-binding protein isoform X1 n=1 Tax=Podarcis raffonei TaxID=65483 RepID=UPI002329271D|nr:calcyclin-binding protein isoform X1 [Podarcis raffonei]
MAMIRAAAQKEKTKSLKLNLKLPGLFSGGYLVFYIFYVFGLSMHLDDFTILLFKLMPIKANNNNNVHLLLHTSQLARWRCQSPTWCPDISTYSCTLVPRRLGTHTFWLPNAKNLELHKDLDEVKELLKKASRKRVHDVLLSEKNKIEREIKNQLPSKIKAETSEEERPPPTGYTVKINNYAWDQSDKFLKIYITLSGVQHLPAENVKVHFTERSFDLLVKNLNNKNYTMTFNNLLKPISVESSSWKIKTDMILILCRKKQEEKWECLTQVEKETKEKEKAAYDTSDPSEGLMNLLKKMYAEGDDEMKRSINKAWVESREKQVKDDLPIDI